MIVGCCYDFALTYFPVEQALPPGAVVAFSIPRTWTQPQAEAPGPGFVLAERSTGGGSEIHLSHNGNMTWWIKVRLTETAEPGDGWIRV